MVYQFYFHLMVFHKAICFVAKALKQNTMSAAYDVLPLT